MILILAFQKKRHEDLYEFESSLVHRVSSRAVRPTQENHVSKTKQPKTTIKVNE